MGRVLHRPRQVDLAGERELRDPRERLAGVAQRHRVAGNRDAAGHHAAELCREAVVGGVLRRPREVDLADQGEGRVARQPRRAAAGRDRRVGQRELPARRGGVGREDLACAGDRPRPPRECARRQHRVVDQRAPGEGQVAGDLGGPAHRELPGGDRQRGVAGEASDHVTGSRGVGDRPCLDVDDRVIVGCRHLPATPVGRSVPVAATRGDPGERRRDDPLLEPLEGDPAERHGPPQDNTSLVRPWPVTNPAFSGSSHQTAHGVPLTWCSWSRLHRGGRSFIEVADLGLRLADAEGLCSQVTRKDFRADAVCEKNLRVGHRESRARILLTRQRPSCDSTTTAIGHRRTMHRPPGGLPAFGMVTGPTRPAPCAVDQGTRVALRTSRA